MSRQQHTSSHISTYNFKIDDKVYHPAFGAGIVLDVVATLGAARALIRFETEGDKWIALGFGLVRHCVNTHAAGPLKPQNSIITHTAEPSPAELMQQHNAAPIIPKQSAMLPHLTHKPATNASPRMLGQSTITRRRTLGFFAGLFAAAPVIARAGLRPESTSSAREISILQTRIAGFAHYQGNYYLAQMQAGQPITLRREPNNPHDRNAIEIIWQGHKIGYVPKVNNRALSRLMDERERISAQLTEVYGRSWEPVRFEVRVQM